MWLWKLNSRRMLLTKVLFLLFNQLMVLAVYGKLCETETGQNNIIVDIEESRGDGECNLMFSHFESDNNNSENDVVTQQLHRCWCILNFHRQRCRTTFTFEYFTFLSDIWYSRQARASGAINFKATKIYETTELKRTTVQCTISTINGMCHENANSI